MVTHDQSLAQKCDHILEIVDGVIVNAADHLQESHQSLLYKERYNEAIIAASGDSDEDTGALFTQSSWESHHLTPNAAKALAKARAQEALARQAAAVVKHMEGAPATTIAKLGTDAELSAAVASTVSAAAAASLQHDPVHSYRVEHHTVTADSQGAPELECRAVIFGEESAAPAYEAAAAALQAQNSERQEKSSPQLDAAADVAGAGRGTGATDAGAAGAASRVPHDDNAQQR